jgi:hypothetical protein
MLIGEVIVSEVAATKLSVPYSKFFQGQIAERPRIWYAQAFWSS